MRKMALALLSAVVAGLLMVPSSVSAKTLSIEVVDRTGDVAIVYDVEAYEYRALYGDNSPIVQTGYFDMTLFRFSLKGNIYTFGMELAADLPQEGDPLPQGVGLLQYTLWLDEYWWDWISDDPAYFIVVLRYDGSSYSAALLEWPSEEIIMSLPFIIEGPRFEVKFSADWMENIPTFWLFPAVVAYFGECPMMSWPDLIDCDADAPGQVVNSIPWPPSES